MLRILILATMLAIALVACSKPADKPAATTEQTKPATPPPIDRKGALLQPGYGAVLVAFPEPAAQGDWLCTVTLQGDHNTDQLPRIPLAETHSTLVFNIPPGQYVVTANALVRKSPIYAGGASNPIEIKAGEVYVLRAEKVADGSYEGVALQDAGSQPWELKSPAEIVKYIAKISDQARG